MSIIQTIRSVGATIAIAFLFQGTAFAGLTGKTLGYTVLFPTISTICCGSGSFVVGPGQELPPGSLPSYNANEYVDVSDVQLIIGQTGGTSYVPGSFNGFHFYDILGNIDALLGVSIDGATNLAGFDASRITFDADNLYLNFQSLSATGAHQVVLDLRFSPTVGGVPEPDSIALIGIAALGLALMRTRRRTAG